MAGGYSLTIKAVDSASGAFDAVNKRVEALNKQIGLARAPFDRLSANFTKFTKVTGLSKIATGFTDVAKSASDAFRSLLRVIEPLAAITGAASIAGLYRLASAWGAYAQQLGNQATRAGLSVTALQTLQGAAQLAGVSTETLTSAMTTLNDNLRDAAIGGAPQFQMAMQALLGPQWQNVIAGKSNAEVMKLLAERLKALKSPTDRAVIGAAVFGGAIDGLTPLLLRGSDGITVLMERAKLLGRQLSEQGVRDANDFTEAQNEVSIAVSGLAHAIGAELGPAFTPLLRDFATWIATSPEANRGLHELGVAAHEVSDWLRSIDWHALHDEIIGVATSADKVAQAFGGWQRVGAIVLGFFVLGFLKAMLVPIATIAIALLKLPISAALAASKANTALATIGSSTSASAGLGTMLGQLGMLAAAWEAINLIGTGTATKDDGLANLLHNMTFDMNPLHWTRTYHPGQEGGADSGGTKDISPGAALDNARIGANEFNKAGYTDEGAAAMLGQSMGESGNNPDPAHNNEGRGLFQWSPQRQADVAAHFKKPFSQLTAQEQYQGAIWEIATKPEFAGLNKAMHTSHDLGALTGAGVGIFEKPADIPGATAARGPMARGALHQIQIDRQNARAAPAAPVAPIGKAGPNGNMEVNIKVDGAAHVTTSTTGDIGPVKVENRNVARDGY